MLGPDGILLPGSDPGRYRDLIEEADASKRNAYLAAGTSVVLAVAAGVLGWKSRDGRPPELAFRF
jgi:hypothetical protein